MNCESIWNHHQTNYDRQEPYIKNYKGFYVKEGARCTAKITYDVFLKGWITATDKSTSENLVTGENKLHGSLNIEYNGDMQAPFLGCKLNVLSWKEDKSGIM